jgi:hypothetical protein
VSRVKSMPTRRARWENGRIRALCVTLGGSSVGRQRGCALASYAAGSAWQAPARRGRSVPENLLGSALHASEKSQ